MDVYPNRNTWLSALYSKLRHTSLPCQYLSLLIPLSWDSQSSAMFPLSFQLPLPLTHMDAPSASIFLPRDICSSTYSQVTFYSLTSTARIPWVRKPEMFPWLLRLMLARQQGEGNEEPSSEFLLDPRLLLRAMPWEGDLPTGLEAIPKGQLNAIGYSMSALLLLCSSGRILGR